MAKLSGGDRCICDEVCTCIFPTKAPPPQAAAAPAAPAAPTMPSATCGCRNATNPYHTCTASCGCLGQGCPKPSAATLAAKVASGAQLSFQDKVQQHLDGLRQPKAKMYEHLIQHSEKSALGKQKKKKMDPDEFERNLPKQEKVGKLDIEGDTSGADWLVRVTGVPAGTDPTVFANAMKGMCRIYQPTDAIGDEDGCNLSFPSLEMAQKVVEFFEEGRAPKEAMDHPYFAEVKGGAMDDWRLKHVGVTLADLTFQMIEFRAPPPWMSVTGLFEFGMFNAWGALGVPLDASPDEVTKAYRIKSMEWHPDRHGAKKRVNSKEMFQHMKTAEQKLKDRNKRAILIKDMDDAMGKYGRERILDRIPQRDTKFGTYGGFWDDTELLLPDWAKLVSHGAAWAKYEVELASAEARGEAPPAAPLVAEAHAVPNRLLGGRGRGVAPAPPQVPTEPGGRGEGIYAGRGGAMFVPSLGPGDVHTMTVAQLRMEAQRVAVDMSKCFEKTDMVNAILDARRKESGTLSASEALKLSQEAAAAKEDTEGIARPCDLLPPTPRVEKEKPAPAPPKVRPEYASVPGTFGAAGVKRPLEGPEVPNAKMPEPEPEMHFTEFEEVKIHGLRGAPELNGKTGVVIELKGDRVVVHLGEGKGQKALKATNLIKVTQQMIEEDATAAAIASNPAPDGYMDT